nr:MFS transporter [Enterococcus thailandicus]
MIYYTNVLGVSGAIVGTLFLVSRILDAFADVFVGRLCDISKLTEVGRFIPWIRRMKYPFCTVAVLMFLPIIQHLPMSAKMIYIFVSYIVYGIFLSTINIPYGAMAQQSVQIRMIGLRCRLSEVLDQQLVGSTTGFFIPILMYTQNKNGQQIVSSERFFLIAIGCASIAFLAYILTCKLSTERVRLEKKKRFKQPGWLKA